MKFLKYLESKNRVLLYSLLKLLLRTKQTDIPVKTDKIKKILITRYDAIGDLIITIPAIRIIKKNFPDVQIDIIASNRNAMIAENEPSITNVYIYDGTLTSLRKLKKLKKQHYDIILSFVFNNKTKAGLISRISANRSTILCTDMEIKRKDLYSAFFNSQINLDDIRDKMTMLEILCRMSSRIFGFEFSAHDINKKLMIDDYNQQKVKVFSDSIDNQNYLVYNISSGNPYRTLSTEKNTEIIKSILNFGYKIVVISDKQDSSKAVDIINNINSPVCCRYRTESINDVIALIKSSSIVFTPDTSVVHIASAFDIPAFIVYSSLASFITEWLPYDSKYEVMMSEKKQPVEHIPTTEIISRLSDFIKSVDSTKLL